MTLAPIISIFPATGGGPVVSGVLTTTREDGKVGLFSPWPSSLSDEAFSVYAAASEGAGGQWLTPAGVTVLALPGQAPRLGVIKFDPEPAQAAPDAALSGTWDPGMLAAALAAADEQWLNPFAAANPDVFQPLRALAQAQAAGFPPAHTTRVPQHADAIAADPAAVDANWSSFFCRILLRSD
jgi:hypothetical protein